MKTLEKVSDFVGKYMAAIVIVVAALALLFPGTFSVVKTAWVNTLLGIEMCIRDRCRRGALCGQLHTFPAGAVRLHPAFRPFFLRCV